MVSQPIDTMCTALLLFKPILRLYILTRTSLPSNSLQFLSAVKDQQFDSLCVENNDGDNGNNNDNEGNPDRLSLSDTSTLVLTLVILFSFVVYVSLRLRKRFCTSIADGNFVRIDDESLDEITNSAFTDENSDEDDYYDEIGFGNNSRDELGFEDGHMGSRSDGVDIEMNESSSFDMKSMKSNLDYDM